MIKSTGCTGFVQRQGMTGGERNCSLSPMRWTGPSDTLGIGRTIGRKDSCRVLGLDKPAMLHGRLACGASSQHKPPRPSRVFFSQYRVKLSSCHSIFPHVYICSTVPNPLWYKASHAACAVPRNGCLRATSPAIFRQRRGAVGNAQLQSKYPVTVVYFHMTIYLLLP